MKCPHCQVLFPLTWRRYFSSPLGVHRCPQCRQRSRLSQSPTYYAAILMTVIIIMGLAFVIPTVYLNTAPLNFYRQGYNWGWGYGIILVFLFLDKFFDNRLRVLEKLKTPEQQGEHHEPSSDL